MNQINPKLSLQKQLHTETTHTHTHTHTHTQTNAWIKACYVPLSVRGPWPLPALSSAHSARSPAASASWQRPWFSCSPPPSSPSPSASSPPAPSWTHWCTAASSCACSSLSPALCNTTASIMETAGMGFTPQPASWQWQEWVLHRSQHHGNGRNGVFTQLTMTAISEKMATSWVRIYGTTGRGKRTVENKDMNSW